MKQAAAGGRSPSRMKAAPTRQGLPRPKQNMRRIKSGSMPSLSTGQEQDSIVRAGPCTRQESWRYRAAAVRHRPLVLQRPPLHQPGLLQAWDTRSTLPTYILCHCGPRYLLQLAGVRATGSGTAGKQAGARPGGTAVAACPGQRHANDAQSHQRIKKHRSSCKAPRLATAELFSGHAEVRGWRRGRPGGMLDELMQWADAHAIGCNSLFFPWLSSSQPHPTWCRRRGRFVWCSAAAPILAHSLPTPSSGWPRSFTTP